MIGSQLVPLLVSAGHRIAGMTRSEANAERLQDLGAHPVVCDVYNLDALVEVLTRFTPDMVIHQLTDLPSDRSAIPESLSANNRIRGEGTRNLIAAARAPRAPQLLAQSVAFQLPGDSAAAVAEHETAVLDAGGVVLRYGHFYGPGTYQGTGKAPPPAVHLAEAARRTVDSLDAPPGIVEVSQLELLPCLVECRYASIKGADDESICGRSDGSDWTAVGAASGCRWS